MALEKLGMSFAQKTASCIKATNATNILRIKPAKPVQLQEFYFAPKSIFDTVEISTEPWRKLIPSLKNKINDKNFLGSGAEARVYAIDDKYVLRLSNGAKKIESEFKPVKDIFEGKNFGQPVAQAENGVSINKRVNGVPLFKANDSNPQIYMQNLREYSNLSDDTLESFVSDVSFINSKGLRIDQGNPENFLFDRQTGKIGIIDLCKKDSSSLDLFEPYGHDWILSPLVNKHDIFTIYKKLSISERKELFELIDKIEKRILPLCKKYGIPQSKWNKDDYRPSSLINLLDMRKTIDVTKCDDLYAPIIYERYPARINFYKTSMNNR